MNSKSILISKTNSIQCNKLVACSAKEFEVIRDSEVVKKVAKAVKAGDKSMKARDFYYMPNAMAINEDARSITRRGNNLISNGRVLIDIDIHDKNIWMPIIFSKIYGKEDKLGVELIEESLSGGVHMIVPIIAGYSARDTLMMWQNYLGLEVDPHTHDVARACYLVPQSMVLYESETFKYGYSWPIQPEDNEDIKAMVNAYQQKSLFDNEYKHKAENVESEPKMVRAPFTKTMVAAPTFTTTYTANSFPEYRSTYIDNKDEMKHLIENVIENYGINTTQKEPEWFRVGIAIKNIIGDDGEEWYHRVSMFYPTYSYDETHRKWEHIVKNGYDKVGMGFFVANLLNCMSESQKAEAFSK